MENKSFLEKLVANTPLAIIVIGLAVFLIGANGGWSRADLRIDSTGWRIAIAVMGLIVFTVGGLSLWKEKAESDRSLKTDNPQATERTKLEGEYHTSDSHHYRMSITHLAGDYYRILNPDWEGLGLFDGEYYYGIFKFNNKATPPERRENWGAHRARLRLKDKSLEVFGIELKETRHFDQFEGEWIREADVK
jgi:hypothetical protein